ncbi:unnamed protein product [Amoebophrya sp. A120]|nr:unnamed protein product [Amoebophrya sp. A120]|eukprot:GSA120T00015204001.1
MAVSSPRTHQNVAEQRELEVDPHGNLEPRARSVLQAQSSASHTSNEDRCSDEDVARQGQTVAVAVDVVVTRSLPLSAVVEPKNKKSPVTTSSDRAQEDIGRETNDEKPKDQTKAVDGAGAQCLLLFARSAMAFYRRFWLFAFTFVWFEAFYWTMGGVGWPPWNQVAFTLHALIYLWSTFFLLLHGGRLNVCRKRRVAPVLSEDETSTTTKQGAEKGTEDHVAAMEEIEVVAPPTGDVESRGAPGRYDAGSGSALSSVASNLEREGAHRVPPPASRLDHGSSETDNGAPENKDERAAPSATPSVLAQNTQNTATRRTAGHHQEGCCPFQNFRCCRPLFLLREFVEPRRDWLLDYVLPPSLLLMGLTQWRPFCVICIWINFFFVYWSFDLLENDNKTAAPDEQQASAKMKGKEAASSSARATLALPRVGKYLGYTPMFTSLIYAMKCATGSLNPILHGTWFFLLVCGLVSATILGLYRWSRRQEEQEERPEPRNEGRQDVDRADDDHDEACNDKKNQPRHITGEVEGSSDSTASNIIHNLPWRPAVLSALLSLLLTSLGAVIFYVGSPMFLFRYPNANGHEQKPTGLFFFGVYVVLGGPVTLLYQFLGDTFVQVLLHRTNADSAMRQAQHSDDQLADPPLPKRVRPDGVPVLLSLVALTVYYIVWEVLSRENSETALVPAEAASASAAVFNLAFVALVVFLAIDLARLLQSTSFSKQIVLQKHHVVRGFVLQYVVWIVGFLWNLPILTIQSCFALGSCWGLIFMGLAVVCTWPGVPGATEVNGSASTSGGGAEAPDQELGTSSRRTGGSTSSASTSPIPPQTSEVEVPKMPARKRPHYAVGETLPFACVVLAFWCPAFSGEVGVFLPVPAPTLVRHPLFSHLHTDSIVDQRSTAGPANATQLTFLTWNAQRGFPGSDFSIQQNFGALYDKLSRLMSPSVDVVGLQELEAQHPILGARDFGLYLAAVGTTPQDETKNADYASFCQRNSALLSSSSSELASSSSTTTPARCAFVYGNKVRANSFGGQPIVTHAGVSLRKAESLVGTWPSDFPFPAFGYSRVTIALPAETTAAGTPTAAVPARFIYVYNAHGNIFHRPRYWPQIAQEVSLAMQTGKIVGAVVMGDMNYRGQRLEPRFQQYAGPIPEEHELRHVLNMNKTREFSFPETRISSPTTRKLDIDHIFVAGEKRVVYARALDELWAENISDHIPVIATIEF